jgi:hypothetical protein
LEKQFANCQPKIVVLSISLNFSADFAHLCFADEKEVRLRKFQFDTLHHNLPFQWANIIFSLLYFNHEKLSSYYTADPISGERALERVSVEPEETFPTGKNYGLFVCICHYLN